MKRIYILLMIVFLAFSLTSCKNKYVISDNADLLVYGEKGKYGFSYVNSDGEKEYYYKVPLNIVVGAYDDSIRSKYTICYVYYNKDGSIKNVIQRKTQILKKGKTNVLHLNYGEKEGYDEDGEYYRYVEWREVIYIYEGYNIYIDSSYFEE
ncbi:MAG: hypothetical protein IJB21_03205 [Bacilli bacterium]|nr:hypothetical protein [Bacilli bacterium]